jgi:hypothetical protein
MLMVENYNPCAIARRIQFWGQSRASMDHNLYSLSRKLIELRMAQAELQSKLESLIAQANGDELGVRRLKKQCLKARDQIARLEAELDPPQPA